LFDAIACRYDFLNSLFSLGIHHYWKAVLIHQPDAMSDGRVLDLCTGTADIGIAYAQREPSCRLIGLDTSARMLSIGHQKIARRQLIGRFSLLRADGLRMPFKNRTFDRIFNSFGLRNEAQFEQALREMARVLRPAGSVHILEFGLPRNGFFRSVYVFYLSRIMPFISRWFLKDRDAFDYLARTIGQFPQPQRIAEIMDNCGFRNITFQPLTGGLVWIYRGCVKT